MICQIILFLILSLLLALLSLTDGQIIILAQGQTTSASPGSVDWLDAVLGGGGVLLLFSTLVAVGLILLGGSENKRKNIRSAGRYGLIGASFLIFTMLVREQIIEAETYVTLAAGALAGFGAYELHRRGSAQENNQTGTMNADQETQRSDQEPPQ